MVGVMDKAARGANFSDTRFSQAAWPLPSDDLVRHFRETGSLEVVNRGANLRASDRTPFVGLLEAGWVLRERKLQNGHTGVIGTYVPGDFIDLDCVVEDLPDDNLYALTDVQIRQIPAQALKDTIRENGELALPVMRRLVAESDWLREGLAAVGQLRATQRLIVYLWQTRRRMIAYGLVEASSQSIPFPLNQVQISRALGVSVVHTSRTIKELREVYGIGVRSQRVYFDDPGMIDAEMQTILMPK